MICFIWILICSWEAKGSSRCKQSTRLSQRGNAVIWRIYGHLDLDLDLPQHWSAFLSNTHSTNEKLLNKQIPLHLWITCIALARFHSLFGPYWIPYQAHTHYITLFTHSCINRTFYIFWEAIGFPLQNQNAIELWFIVGMLASFKVSKPNSFCILSIKTGELVNVVECR